MEALPHPQSTLKPSRPRSVAILAGLQLLQSLALLGFAIYLVTAAGWSQPAQSPASQFMPLALFDNMVSGVATIVISLLGVFVAFALVRMKSWAWLAAMGLQGLGLLAGLVGYIRHRPNYVGMLIGIFLVLYLNQQEILEAFREKRGTS